jgi:hypothetical protein
MTNIKWKKDQQAKKKQKNTSTQNRLSKINMRENQKTNLLKVWNSQAKQQASNTTNKKNEQVKPTSKTTNK